MCRGSTPGGMYDAVPIAPMLSAAQQTADAAYMTASCRPRVRCRWSPGAQCTCFGKSNVTVMRAPMFFGSDRGP